MLNYFNKIQLSILFSFVLLGATHFVIAAEEDEELNLDQESVEKIQVTGSHIRRIDTQGSTTLTVLSRRDLEQSGFNTLADVVRNLSINSFGVPKYTTLLSGIPPSVNFRGLPEGYTLFLLDGRRVDLNINSIPMSAIERVEITVDGSSSVYGSDALGGTVNFITKTGDFGWHLNVGTSYPQLPETLAAENIKELEKYPRKGAGGDSQNMNFSYGFKSDRMEGIAGASFSRKAGVWHKNREYSRLKEPTELELKEANARLNLGWSVFGSPGTYFLKFKDEVKKEDQRKLPTSFAMKGCDTVDKSQIEGTDLANTICRFNYSQYSEYSADVLVGSLFGKFIFDVDDKTTAKSTAILSHQHSVGYLAPAPDVMKKEVIERYKKRYDPNNKHPEVPKIWTDSIDQLRAANSPYEFDSFVYRMVDLKEGVIGLRKTTYKLNELALQNSVEYFIDDNWRWLTALDFNGEQVTINLDNYLDKRLLLKLAYEDKWNPFDEKIDDLTEAQYKPLQESYEFGIQMESQVDGQLLSSQLGTLNAAAGVRFSIEGYSQFVDKATNDKWQWGGGDVTIGGGSRDKEEAFAELAFVRDNLDISTSINLVRYGLNNLIGENKMEKTSDFYSYDPKLELRYQPTKMIGFNASVGTGFKTPGLDLIYNTVKDHPFGKDGYKCAKAKTETEQSEDSPEVRAACVDIQTEATYKGNPNLKPEKSIFLNVGMRFQPANKLFASVEFFQNTIKDRISNPNITILSTAQYKKKHLEQKKEETGELSTEESEELSRSSDLLKESNYKAIRKPNNDLESSTSFYYNGGSYKVSGLDTRLNLSTNLPLESLLGASSISLDTSLTLFLEAKFNAYPGAFPIVDRLGHFGFPSFKTQSSLAWRHISSGLLAQVVARGVGPYNKATSNAGESICDEGGRDKDGNCYKVPTHFQYDLSFTIPIDWSRFTSMRGSGSLVFNIENILGQYPPSFDKADILDAEGKVTGTKTVGAAFNSVSQATGVSATGGSVVDGLYSGDGRVWSVQYRHHF